jgi:hypothetical protein
MFDKVMMTRMGCIYLSKMIFELATDSLMMAGLSNNIGLGSDDE